MDRKTDAGETPTTYLPVEERSGPVRTGRKKSRCCHESLIVMLPRMIVTLIGDSLAQVCQPSPLTVPPADSDTFWSGIPSLVAGSTSLGAPKTRYLRCVIRVVQNFGADKARAPPDAQYCLNSDRGTDPTHIRSASSSHLVVRHGVLRSTFSGHRARPRCVQISSRPSSP